MNQYDNTNRGVLFVERNKKSDNHPDFNGKINVDGVERYISAWMNKSQKGEDYFSLSLGKVVEQPKAQQKPAEDDDSDVPF